MEEILSTQFARKATETILGTQDGRPCASNVFRCLLEEILEWQEIANLLNLRITDYLT